MFDWISPVTFWHWESLAVLLIIMELLAPAFFFLWLGIAAALTGLLLFLFPDLSLTGQALFFAIASVLSMTFSRTILKKNLTPSDRPTLNQRGQHYVGKHYTLEQAIENGTGRVRVGDTLWRVEGKDLPAGTTVRVVGVEGASLQVEELSES
ncbi:MAG: NfeD family protein [Magnetococcales bacterium]|nr:NfeD family protein [Magnetococcales bacterium]